MSANTHAQRTVNVLVIADVLSNAQALVERVLRPAGINAWTIGAEAPSPNVLVVDVTQLRGDPLAGLRAQRVGGEKAPAIVLAAHFSNSRLRELFRLGVADFLLKPYQPSMLCEAVFELSKSHIIETNTRALARQLERMHGELQRRSKEIWLLSEIGRAVVSLGDLDIILRRVVEAAVFITDAEEASIYLTEPDTNELVLRASIYAGDRNATLQRLRVNDTLVGEVIATGQPVLRQPSLDGGPVKVQTGFLVQSLVKVPIQLRNNVVGVLGIYNRMTPRAFTDHHLTLLTALAHWTGAALEQASLINQARTNDLQSSPITAAPLTFIEGLDQAISALEPLLSGSLGQITVTQRQVLSTLREKLKSLHALPVAALAPDEAKDLVDLPSILQQVAEVMQPAARRRNLHLIAEDNHPIPLFRGDSSRIRRIIETLVAAAINRTVKGHIVLETHRMEIRQGRSDNLPLPHNVHLPDGVWAIVRVSDTSSGFSPQTIQALTNPSPDPSTGQIGRGLSMGEIRMIVESMRGLLWHEQTPASAAITIALPIA
jgi:signal transduction histidine kinase/DNA-binding NarL/FixJ family response regulator